MTDREDEQVGSVGEEAVKLFAALQDWARDNGSDYAHAASEAMAGAAGMVGDVNEHIATGGADCKFCPVCQVISAVRGMSPEVKHHLTSAASSLVQAVSSAMAAHAEPSRRTPDMPVERIDLSDEDDWEED
jgi:hypothetical protein